MKKIFKTLSLMMLALVASTAVAQKQYCGDVVAFANVPTMENAWINLWVEKTGDLTARVTIEPNNPDLKLDFIELQVAGLPTHAQSFEPIGSYSVDLTFTSAPAMITINNLLWSFEKEDGNYLSGTLQALFGTCDGGQQEDTELPTDLTLLSVTPAIATASFSLQATDNSGIVKYTVTVGDKSATATGNAGVETVVTVEGLTPATAYDYTITAEDLAGNVCATTLNGSFTTESAEQWCEKIITHFGYTEPGYMANAILVTIEKINETTVELRASSNNTERKIDFMEVRIDGKTQVANSLDAAVDDFEEVVLTFTYDAVPAVLNVNMILWSNDAMGGNEMIQNYVAAAGVCQSGTPDPSDTEAPVINSAVVSEPTHESATLIVNITDNVTETVTVEVSADNFATVMTTWYGIDCGSDVALTIEGLEAETIYNLAVRATDASENVSEVKAIDEFVTGSAPIYTAATFNGYMVKNEDWSVVNTPADADAPFAPHLYYSIITNEDNTLTFNLELTEKLVGLVGQIWINNGLIVSQPVGEYTLNFTTTQAYERDEVLKVYFRFEYPTSVSATKEFDFVVGSSQNLPNAIEGVETAKADVYAANGAIYIGSAYAGQKVEVYNIDGRLVYSANAKEKIELIHNGIYIVKVCGVAYKVVL